VLLSTSAKLPLGVVVVPVRVDVQVWVKFAMVLVKFAPVPVRVDVQVWVEFCILVLIKFVLVLVTELVVVVVGMFTTALDLTMRKQPSSSASSALLQALLLRRRLLDLE
jgi:hypothetical protein